MLHLHHHPAIAPGHILLHPLITTLHGYQPRTPIQVHRHPTPTLPSPFPLSITGVRCRLLIPSGGGPHARSKGPSLDEATLRRWLTGWLVGGCRASSGTQGTGGARGAGGAVHEPHLKHTGTSDVSTSSGDSSTHGVDVYTNTSSTPAAMLPPSLQQQQQQQQRSVLQDVSAAQHTQCVCIAVSPYTLVHVGMVEGVDRVSKEGPVEQGPLLLVEPMGAHGLLGHPVCIQVENDGKQGWVCV